MSTPRVQSAVPTFLVDDVAATGRWYVGELGFAIAGRFPERPPYAYMSLQLGPAELMLLSLPGYVKPDLRAQRPAGLWDAYIRMDGVRTVYQALAGRPCVQMPLRQQPYGNWEFEVRDPNGYVLVFGGGE